MFTLTRKILRLKKNLCNSKLHVSQTNICRIKLNKSCKYNCELIRVVRQY